MNAPKIILTLFFIVLISTIYALFSDNFILSLSGHLCLMNILGLWYFVKNYKNFNSKNLLIVFALFLSSISDSVYYFEISKTYIEFFQILLSCIVNLIFILVMRIEGVRVYTDSIYDFPKIIIPLILIFLFFGFVIMPDTPNLIFFVSIMYAVLEILIITHGYFRVCNRKSFMLVVFGVTILLIKDAIYGIHFFYFDEKFAFLYKIQYPINVIAFFLVVYGLSENHQKLSFEFSKNINKRITKFISELFEWNFSKLFKQKLS